MRFRSGFRHPGFVVCLCACAAAGVALAAEGRPRPSLAVESEAGASRLWVDVVRADGTAERRLVRETTAAVRPLASGWEPTGRAGFVTWEEPGARWFSYSRDGGESWSTARPLHSELRLRDGAVARDERMPAAPEPLRLPPGGGLYLVQFKTISLPEWRAALAGAGAEVLGYFPENAHVVRLGAAPAARVAALGGLDIVERVEPYHPWYRLSSELRAWLEQPADAAPERMRVRVAAFEWGAAGKGRIAALAGDVGAAIVALPPSGHVVDLMVDRAQLVRIAAHDDVEWIDPWAPPSVDMDVVRHDSGADWLEDNYRSVVDNLGYCGQGVRGEVMDVGIWEAHPDFEGIRLHGHHNVDAHGTSTYGIVFGRGRGDARARGLLPCGEGIFGNAFYGDRYANTAELKQAPYFASFQTNSWGSGDSTRYTSVSEEMDEIIWRLDIAITQSQGNSGTQVSRPEAWAKNVISVGGIGHLDTRPTSDDAWAGGASVGPAADGRIKPDVSYWYDGIYTTDMEPGGYVPDSLYTPDFGGTSASTPQVAGVLGLMLQMWKENVWGTDHPPTMSVFEAQPHFSTLKALLVNNAQQYPFAGEAHDLSRYKQGWGRPSVRVAAERASRSAIVDQEVLLEVGELATYRIDVAPGESELKVTMVYPDPPGTPATALARVNDLDLRVISPSGAVYHGNVGLTAGNASVAAGPGGGATNRIDTVENVFVVDPEPGTWSVAVEAAEINSDACPVGHPSVCGPTPGGTPETDATFSLVVTGGTRASSCSAPAADITATPNPARVGGAVQFHSDVSGGAGGPYTYWWDFDADGVGDSTEANPVHVYARPFGSSAKLWVADVANCPVTVREPVTVTGPDPRYDGFVALTEVHGNGNGGVDPGETWQMNVTLRNAGSEPAVGVTAELVADPASPVAVSLLQAVSTYPDIAAGVTAPSDLAYVFQIDRVAPCGSVSLGVSVRTTNPANSYPTEVGVIQIPLGRRVSLFYDGFETDRGWRSEGGGEWERGMPLGLGQPDADPASAYEGEFVLGNDLTGFGVEAPGNYENGVDSPVLSPVIDIPTGFVPTRITITNRTWRHLGNGDWAWLYAHGPRNGLSQVYDPRYNTAEGRWIAETFDLPDFMNGEEWLELQFHLKTDAEGTNSGWNIDDLEVQAHGCEALRPVLPGAASNLLVRKAAPDQLTLEWGADCGAATAYGIYRGDLRVGYDSIIAEPGACEVTGTNGTIPLGSGDAEFFLVVPHKDGADGSYGTDSAGTPRPPPAPAGCYPQGAVDACAP